MSIDSGETHPFRLDKYADTIDPDQARLEDSSTVDYRFAHGSGEREDELLEEIDEQLPVSLEAYANDLALFLGTSPDNGVPTAVTRWPNAEFQHNASGRDLQGWLQVAKKHLSGAEDEAMVEIVSCINASFDPQQFEAGIASAIGGSEEPLKVSIGPKMRAAARSLVQATTEQLCAFSTSETTIQRFIGSDFLKAYGTQLDTVILKRRILELQGLESSPAHAELLDTIVQTITPENWSNMYREIDWVVCEKPEAMRQLITTYPEIAAEVRAESRLVLSRIKPAERNKQHVAALAELEAQAMANPGEYVAFVSNNFYETGVMNPEHIEVLKSMVKNNVNPGLWADRILCAHLPLDDVDVLLENQPGIIGYAGIREICVRRFAAAGQTEKAYALARTSDVPDDSRNILLEPVRNLLTLYEETGDEAAYLEALHRFRTGVDDMPARLLDDVAIHELLARTYVAADKNGHNERAEEALAEMETYYSDASPYVAAITLRCRTRLELDAGRPHTAEKYAVQLYNLKEQSEYEWDREDSTKSLLYVLRTYMQQNDASAANKLFQTYFAVDKPKQSLITATAIINGDRSVRLRPDYGEVRLNALTHVLNPY